MFVCFFILSLFGFVCFSAISKWDQINFCFNNECRVWLEGACYDIDGRYTRPSMLSCSSMLSLKIVKAVGSNPVIFCFSFILSLDQCQRPLIFYAYFQHGVSVSPGLRWSNILLNEFYENHPIIFEVLFFDCVWK